MCPRYMNVPSPAPCHVNVAGVGKQSVWGLRVIARTQLSLWHDFGDSSIPRSGANLRFADNHELGFALAQEEVGAPTTGKGLAMRRCMSCDVTICRSPSESSAETLKSSDNMSRPTTSSPTMSQLVHARGKPTPRFNHVVKCTFAVSLCIILNGCFFRPVPQVTKLQVPITLGRVQDGQETSSQKTPSIVHQVALGRLISFNKGGVLLETRDILSALPVHATTHSFPDVRVSVPHITEELARSLLGIAGSGHDKQTLEPQSLSFSRWVGRETSFDEGAQLIFSDNYESVLDLRTLLREFKTGRIQPNADALNSYLIAEQVTARTISVLLPAHTPEEVARKVACYASADCRISVQAVNDRWQLTSPLPSPRPILAGFLALRVHHSKHAHFAPSIQTPAHTAMTLGWIESLPTPTDFWNSSPPKPQISLLQSQSLLNNTLTAGGLYPAVAQFSVPNGYAVLTPLELLESEDSSQPDYTRRFKIESHSPYRYLCRLWNCSAGTVREMVLLVGAEPPYSGISPVVPLNDQIQSAIRGSMRAIEPDRPIGSTCYALVYVYDHQWDGSFRVYSLSAYGIRALQHLQSTNLLNFLKCQQ
jgi:hypothetical protein